jgi:matrix metalloproteinase-14 (membrane-inserted)
VAGRIPWQQTLCLKRALFGPADERVFVGGVLAHAFYPTSGELHLDDTEQWVDSKEEGVDIMTVAAHELGHALGLGHSAVPGALMAPYYQGYDPEFTLPQDDIDAIQSLYGEPLIRCTVV